MGWGERAHTYVSTNQPPKQLKSVHIVCTSGNEVACCQSGRMHGWVSGSMRSRLVTFWGDALLGWLDVRVNGWVDGWVALAMHIGP